MDAWDVIARLFPILLVKCLDIEKRVEILKLFAHKSIKILRRLNIYSVAKIKDSCLYLCE